MEYLYSVRLGCVPRGGPGPLNLLFLNVHCVTLFTVPPDHVVIDGPKEVQADQSYTYRCEAKNANPAPTIQWIINGVVTTAGVSTQMHPPPPKPSGYVSIHHPTGWRVTSDFALNVMDEDTEIAVTCNAISHGHHGDTMLRKAETLLTVLRKCQLLFIYFLS